MTATPVFSLEKINFAYPDRPPLFRDLDFALREGDRVGLHGPNGSGKTSFLRLVMGLEKPQSGKIFYRDALVDSEAALHAMRCRVGLVLQNSDDQLFSATVLEDVAFGPLNLGLKRREARDRAMETLTGMGLEKLADRLTHRLSVGEKKMASIAAVLSMRPEALLLDEPSASLDDEARARIIDILNGDILNSRSIARIVVSHDHEFLKKTSASFIRINDAGGIETTTTVE